MIKTFGLSIVLLFSILAGTMMAKEEKQRREVCFSVTGLFLYISNEILRHKILNQIICEYYSDYKKSFIDVKSKEELCSFLKQFNRKGRAGIIVGKAIEYLNSIGKCTNANTESERCRAIYDELYELCNEYKEESVKHSELYSKLGIMGGLALCIILI